MVGGTTPPQLPPSLTFGTRQGGHRAGVMTSTSVMAVAPPPRPAQQQWGMAVGEGRRQSARPRLLAMGMRRWWVAPAPHCSHKSSPSAIFKVGTGPASCLPHPSCLSHHGPALHNRSGEWPVVKEAARLLDRAFLQWG